MSNRNYALIIDDEPENVEIVSEMLKEAIPTLQSISTTDAPSGLMKMRYQSFDLVVCDVRLKKASVASLAQDTSELPVEFRPKNFILMSGGADPNVPPTKLSKIHFIPKPLAKLMFIDLVRKLLNPPSAETTTATPVASKATRRFDIEFIAPSVESTLDVLKTMAGVKAKIEEVFVRRPGEPAFGDITAVISMNSAAYLGSMALTFEEKSFLYIVNRMLGEKYAAIDGENRDAAAELCNQIFGRTKSILDEKGHTLQPAIPTLIVEPKHIVKHFAHGPCIAIRFSTEAGMFVVEAVVQSR